MKAENRRGVAHRVGAVTDDDTVRAVGDLALDIFGQGHVLGPPHVLGEDTEDLLGGEIADVCQLRNRTVELPGREGRDHRPGTVVEARGDGAAGSQQSHIGEVWP